MYANNKQILILTPSNTLQQNWKDEIINIEVIFMRKFTIFLKKIIFSVKKSCMIMINANNTL